MRCKSFFVNDLNSFNAQKLSALDMAFFVYPHSISLDEELEKPKLTKTLTKLSLDAELILFIYFKAKVKQKTYLSVMVMEKGRILGISDCLSRQDYDSSDNQRIYMLSKGKAGVIVDNDIFYPESARSLFLHNADYIVYMTFERHNFQAVKTINAHRAFSALPVYAVFGDCLCYFAGNFVKKNAEELLISESGKNTRIPSRVLHKFASPTFEY
ncbi:MAG: hypothetical protein ACOYEC_03275 [Christensenellales bacterium]|jgi:hypothetical protein|nr:hypothetical protein [Clostridiales bacterium]